jgi:hypothetical protein
MNLHIRCASAALVIFVAHAARAQEQSSAADPSARLRQVLPASVATRVLGVIANARSRGLPADGLENRALKFAARGVDANAIERSIVEQEARMEQVRDLLQSARGHKPADDEIEAGAEALRKGVSGAKVSALAKTASDDRSLAVPLYVVGSLLDRGLPSDSALRRVTEKLQSRASDRDIEKMAADLPVQSGGARGAEMGRALGATKRPGGAAGNGQGGSAGGPPAGVPGNGGKPATPPGLGKKPAGPPGKKP